MIKVVHIVSEHPAKMLFVEDKDMIQTLPADAAKEALANRIGPWDTDGSAEDLDPARGDASH